MGGRKLKYNPHTLSPEIIPEKKLPFAHQVWTISISPRVLLVCNFTTNQDTGRNSLALPAPAEDASFTVHSTVQKVLSFGWLPLQSMQDSVSVSATGLALHGTSCACLLCSVWALSLQAPGIRAEKCVGRRQRPAGLILWRLLFQSCVHSWQILPYVCDHHSTPLIYFLFFLSSDQQPPSLMSPSLYLNVFHNHLPLSDISLS